MSNSDPWQDFDQVRHSIRNNTVDKLKQIVAGFNEECSTHMAKSGKKQELIDRIVDALDQWRKTSNEDRWAKARAIIAQVRNLGHYIPPNRVGVGVSQSASVSHVAYDPPKPNLYSPSVSGQNSSSSIGHYDPYAPPRRPAQATTLPVASSATNIHKLPIRFKETPFFSVEQAVSGVTECPESTSATDRRAASFTFSLTNDQLTKMKSPGSKYQLRLFCTSSMFYAGFSTFRTNPLPCPIEFPPTCEVRINTNPVQASLKGLKKRPGTAPAPDISALTRLSGSNKVDMVYVNSQQQPVQSKKFYIIVMLVEATTTDALVAKLKTQNYRSCQEIQEKMRQSMNEDEDIIAGSQKMSLKCPLTFVRINTPCRSEKCVHPQCFDATSWFTMMEMTTTWLCPVCERVLEFKELIIDGYFDAILKATPDSVEDVVVEADGEWHTADNEYASAKWKATHRPQISASVQAPPIAPSVQPVMNGSSQVNGKGKEIDVEILVLDSDEDVDEGPEPSPSYASSSRTSFDAIREPTVPLPHHLPSPRAPLLQSHHNKTVIDLTLDDSDEEQPPVANNFGKRKASDANLSDSLPDQLWKKGRIDSSRILPTPRPSAPINTANRPMLNNHPPSPTSMRYPSFANNTLPPPAPVFSYNRSVSGTGSSSPLHLPPISTAFSPRQPTSPRHHAWS